MTDLDHSTRYDLMTTNQASPSEMAEWLKEPDFAAYVAERQGKKTPKPAPSDDAVIAGRTLAEWQEFARRDDCLERMVPSDLRQLIGTAIRSLATIPAAEPDAWLIRKRGYFYRPARHGYTAHKDQAGRYTEAEAKAEAAIEPDIMQAILADDWPIPAPPAKEGR